MSVVAVENRPAAGLVDTTVPNNVPVGLGPIGSALRRARPKSRREAGIIRRLSDAAAATGATTFVPTHSSAVAAAVAAARVNQGTVLRQPQMECPPDVDLIAIAPTRPDLAAPVLGFGSFQTPDDRRAPYSPVPDRHQGRRVIICYRKTDSNPGKYLESALRRSGADVQLEKVGIDLDSVDAGTDLIVFVEGPYPALEVTGATEVPTLFWAHHGEHHLHTNLRLANRYRADGVLLAHSWHLAPWFPAPIYRFPFGVATEVLDPSLRLKDRPFDVALVGAKLWEGGPYGRRQEIVRDLEASFPAHRLAFGEKVTADVMADMYARARIVVNEGGTRHFPITMRVLEAVGSGAVLLSDHLPGMEMMLEPEAEYAVLSPDVVKDVRELLSDPGAMQDMADRALTRSLGINTYDHRVDELFQIAAEVEKRDIPAIPELEPMAELIRRDAEVQKVVEFGAPELVGALPDREIWGATEISRHRLRPRNLEAAAVRQGGDPDLMEKVLASARRYIYVDGPFDGLDEFVEAQHPNAVVSQHGSARRYDLMAEAYRIMPHEVVTE
ncbi:MAG: glycosyltransferase [Acidimicrobiia bacterium]